jgi:hypothetical protein
VLLDSAHLRGTSSVYSLPGPKGAGATMQSPRTNDEFSGNDPWLRRDAVLRRLPPPPPPSPRFDAERFGCVPDICSVEPKVARAFVPSVA